MSHEDRASSLKRLHVIQRINIELIKNEIENINDITLIKSWLEPHKLGNTIPLDLLNKVSNILYNHSMGMKKIGEYFGEIVREYKNDAE